MPVVVHEDKTADKETLVKHLKIKQTQRRMQKRDEFHAKKTFINDSWGRKIAERRFHHSRSKPIWEAASEDSAEKWLQILDEYTSDDERHDREVQKEELREWEREVQIEKKILDERDAKEMDELLNPKPKTSLRDPFLDACSPPAHEQLRYYKNKYPHLFKEENTAQYQDQEEWDHYNFQDSQGNVFSIE